MKTYEGISDAATDARNYLIRNEKDLPDHLKDRLVDLTTSGTSPVDLVVTFAEAVYANQGEFKKEAKDIASGCAVVAEVYNFHGLADDQRGGTIARALGGDKVAKDKLPAPRQDLEKPKDPEA